MRTPRSAGAEQASERARRQVPDPGVPDVERGDALNRGYASALDTRTLDSPELQQAFDEVPECR